MSKMTYFDQKYRIPTPPKNPKVLEYKQEAKVERFKKLLNELQQEPPSANAADKLIDLYQQKLDPVHQSSV